MKDSLSGQFVSYLTKVERKEHRRRSVARSNNKRQVSQREWQLWHKYGITVETYESMLAAQDGGCAICGSAFALIEGKRNRLHVDHDHDSGLVRGILCFKCNIGLGKFNDNPELLEKAVKYLQKGAATRD